MNKSWYNPILRCVCLAGLGAVLQIAVGDLDNSFLRYPWSAIAAVNYLYLLVLAYAMEDKWRWVRSLRDARASVVALASMVIMLLIFGLTRQDGATEGVAGALGFTRMTSSWVFNLLLLNFITSLGLAVVDDWRWVRQRRLASVLSHTAVFIALAAAWFGSGDKLRVKMPLYLDQPAYEAVSADGRVSELPFVVTLRDFQMEEYAPKLYLYNSNVGQSSQSFLSVDEHKAQVEDWLLQIVEYQPMAGRMPQTEEYREMKHVGATHAAYVVAERGTERKEGWVSCGSHIFAAQSLDLGRGQFVVMPAPEAKRYLSRIEVQQADGSVELFDLEVNHPAKVGAWHIYQSSYDVERGRWSTMSVVECVRDGWWRVVSVALWMILASAVVMFITAGGRKRGGK